MKTASCIVASLLALAADSACSNHGSPTTPAGGTVRGFGISPVGFGTGDYSKITTFFSEVGEFGRSAIMWNGAWYDDGDSTKAGTTPVAAKAIEENGPKSGFTAVPVFGWRSGTTLYLAVPGDATNNWTNSMAKASFKSMLVNFAQTYKPVYMLLGNENDFYYEQSASDYANWISFYNSAYDAIKAASPQTNVGPVFNVEHTAGTGTLNGWTTPRFGAIDAHDLTKVDFVGLSLYPWLGYAKVESVPDSYLDAVSGHLGGKPIAITETGWPGENLGGLNPAWEASESAQTAYVTRLTKLLAGRSVKFANWLFFNGEGDPGSSPIEWKLFGSVSIRDSAGKARAVYPAWQAFNLN